MVRVADPRHAADAGDPAVAHRDRAGDRWGAGAVDDAGVGDEEIERPPGRLCREGRGAERGGRRQGQADLFHGRIICPPESVDRFDPSSGMIAFPGHRSCSCVVRHFRCSRWPWHCQRSHSCAPPTTSF